MSTTSSPTAEGAVPPPVRVEVVRSGFAESAHDVAVVALASDGAVVLSAGDVEVPVFPRSSNKPFQALGMLRCGLGLDGELLALAASSHSGEPFHVDGVHRILLAAGLDESALQTPPDLPSDAEAARAVVRAGGGRAPIYMNCSGKHAAMLATCVANGWELSSYRDPGHPLQKAIADALEDVTGERVAAVGTDGCGAPVLAVSLHALARGFAALVTAPAGTPERRLAAAVTAHPDFLGGTRRDVTALIRALPGSVAKDGAEGVYALALPDGRAIAIKVLDGADRARMPTLVAVFEALGWTDGGDALREVGRVPVLGHGVAVGELRATVPH